jgi:two-component system response regulator GlrR
MTRHETLTPDDLPDEIVIQADGRPSTGRGGFFSMRTQRLATFEKEYLANLLQACQGDASRAAREAQVPRGTLYRFLKKHGLNPEDFRS